MECSALSISYASHSLLRHTVKEIYPHSLGKIGCGTSKPHISPAPETMSFALALVAYHGIPMPNSAPDFRRTAPVITANVVRAAFLDHSPNCSLRSPEPPTLYEPSLSCGVSSSLDVMRDPYRTSLCKNDSYFIIRTGGTISDSRLHTAFRGYHVFVLMMMLAMEHVMKVRFFMVFEIDIELVVHLGRDVHCEVGQNTRYNSQCRSEPVDWSATTMSVRKRGHQRAQTA